MAISYIWDTNTVIYYFNKQFPKNGEKILDNILGVLKPSISIITEIELLCWRSASDLDIIILRSFINDSIVYELENSVKLKTIEIRKQFNLKLPDAVIVATAIVNDLILISNDRRFAGIPSLKLLNLFEA